MADQIDALRKAIEDLTVEIRQGGGSALGAKPPAPAPKPKSSEHPLASFSAALLKAIPLIGGVGVIAGLRDTREGYQLQYQLGRLSYELADLVRGPLMMFAREIAGAGNVMHAINRSPDLRHIGAGAAIGGMIGGAPGAAAGAAVGSSLDHPASTLAGVGTFSYLASVFGTKLAAGVGAAFYAVGATVGPAVEKALAPKGDISLMDSIRIGARGGAQQINPHLSEILRAASKEPAAKRQEAVDDEGHLQPIMHTSFGSLEGLQNTMQALVTENPAIDLAQRELTVIEKIYNLIADWINGSGGHAVLIPDPAIKRD